jgi:KaiC/GvpD/RAD55 family RecA-like ATPase
MPNSSSKSSHQQNESRENGLWCHLHDYDQLFLSYNEKDKPEGKDKFDAPERGIPFGASVLLSGPPGSGKTTFALGLARSIMIRAKKKEMVEVEVEVKEKKPNTRFVLFYISPEVSRERLENNYREFGWFGKAQLFPGHFPTLSVWHTPGNEEVEPPNFHTITTYPEMYRPVPSPDDQVNHIFNRIARTITPSEGQSDIEVRYIVVVDSITALLKGCLTPGDERRQTHEILHRFTTAFGEKNLALILMTAEQDHTEEPGERHSLVEDYLAGIVIRLAHQPLPLGRTTRTLEILKSQGVHMVPGIHTWTIITNDRYDHHLRTNELRHEVISNALLWKDGKGPDTKDLLELMKTNESKRAIRWGTVVIFGRPKLQHPDLPDHQVQDNEKDYLSTGTPGLDEILTGEQEYWLRSTGTRKKDGAPGTALRKGKTTLLAGTVGTGTTKLCLQFLLHDVRHKIISEVSLDEKSNDPTSLLVLLNVKAETVVDEAWSNMINLADLRREPTRKPTDTDDEWKVKVDEWKVKVDEWKVKVDEWKKSDTRRNYLRVLDFNQSNFEFNQLISHLRWAIERFKPNRIAFDGLSEYLIRSNAADAPGMLEAINSLIIHHPIYYPDAQTNPEAHVNSNPVGKTPALRPAVMMTYELTMDGDPLAPQSLGVSADNIIAVRQVTLQDEIHKVVYVVKAGERGSDQNIRELYYDTKTGLFEVRSGLDSFNGLLTHKVKKAEVLLQLFGENEKEQEFNEWLELRVRRLKTLKFTILDFSRPDIGRTLEDTHSQTLFPPADLKLVSVDEWWLSYDRNVAGNPSETKPKGTDNHKLLNLHDMWNDTEDTETLCPSWQDYLCFELDKAGPITEEQKLQYYGVPAHMDYGLFCVNVPQLKSNANWKDPRYSLDVPCPEKNSEDVTRGDLISMLPTLWADIIKEDGQRWFQTGNTTIVHFISEWYKANKMAASGQDGPFGFSFDIATRENCVSFFFELAWAFGASEDCLSLSDGKLLDFNKTALQDSFHFLQYLVLEGFMPHRATVETSCKSLFSRHYYSTLQAALRTISHTTDTDVPTSTPPLLPALVAMPWFPGGSQETSNHLELIASARGREICKRLTHLWKRCKEAGGCLAGENGQLSPMSEILEADVQDLKQVQSMTASLLEALNTMREKVTSKEDPTATYNDLCVMMRQHLFRLRLFQMDNDDKDYEFVGRPDPLTLPHGLNKQLPKQTVPAGFCCAGSWYYGVHRTSSSPSLARELLQEMTSLEAAKKMAGLGAGIPSRGDFFELHGEENVPGMEYLSWNQLVTECGATVRRRGRIVPSTVNPAPVHQTIHREILDALQRAYLRKRDYLPGDTVNNKKIINTVNLESHNAVSRIVECVKKATSQNSKANPNPPITSPQP